MTPEAASVYIHNEGIHILINLNGYTKWSKNEIFAQQPAPLQINFKGYPGTLGTTLTQRLSTDSFLGDGDWHQYMLGDNIVTPIGNEVSLFYSSKWR